MNITILGAGNMGSALAKQLSLAAHSVRVISRDQAKSRELAARYRGVVAATANEGAADADAVIVATGYEDAVPALRSLGSLAGKVVIDVTNPLTADFTALSVGHSTSAAEQIARAISTSATAPDAVRRLRRRGSAERRESMKAPVLFISHGAPTFAIEPGALGPQLGRLGEDMAGLEAVLVISPHWQTSGVTVMTSPAPATLHDFGGFPASLHRLRYDVAGHPSLASRAATLVRQAGFTVELDERRSLDHGAWVPLRHLLPAAQTPVFQVSMPYDLDAHGAFQLGYSLAPLRDSGVLIVGSGSLTHNLGELRRGPAPQSQYAQEFARWVREAILRRDIGSLLSFRSKAPHAHRAHPTPEHFLPLIIALGASTDSDSLVPIEGGMTYGVLSMDSYAWGVDACVRLAETEITAI